MFFAYNMKRWGKLNSDMRNRDNFGGQFVDELLCEGQLENLYLKE